MNINGKDIVQFDNNIFVDSKTGKRASKKDKELFLARKEAFNKKLTKRARQREVKAQKWHEKYDPKIKEYHGWGNDGIGQHYSEFHLINMLATDLFDKNRYFFIGSSKKLKGLARIKKAFPSYWRRALAQYKCGNHDT